MRVLRLQAAKKRNVCEMNLLAYFVRLVSLFALHRLDCVPVEITANIYHDKMIVQQNFSFFAMAHTERFVFLTLYLVLLSLYRAHFFVWQLQVSR